MKLPNSSLSWCRIAHRILQAVNTSLMAEPCQPSDSNPVFLWIANSKRIKRSMTTPQPIAAYVRAANSHDTDSLLTSFTDDSRVTDEGQDYHGLDQIRAWSNKVNEQYYVALDILDCVEVGNETVWTVQVSGTFDGSPIQLPLHVTLRADKIAALNIG